MNELLNAFNLKQLDDKSLTGIFGGAPSAKTSLWYDVFYYATTSLLDSWTMGGWSLRK